MPFFWCFDFIQNASHVLGIRSTTWPLPPALLCCRHWWARDVTPGNLLTEALPSAAKSCCSRGIRILLGSAFSSLQAALVSLDTSQDAIVTNSFMRCASESISLAAFLRVGSVCLRTCGSPPASGTVHWHQVVSAVGLQAQVSVSWVASRCLRHLIGSYQWEKIEGFQLIRQESIRTPGSYSGAQTRGLSNHLQHYFHQWQVPRSSFSAGTPRESLWLCRPSVAKAKPVTLGDAARGRASPELLQTLSCLSHVLGVNNLSTPPPSHLSICLCSCSKKKHMPSSLHLPGWTGLSSGITTVLLMLCCNLLATWWTTWAASVEGWGVSMATICKTASFKVVLLISSCSLTLFHRLSMKLTHKHIFLARSRSDGKYVISLF